MDTTMATTSTTTMPIEPIWEMALFRPTRRLRNIPGGIGLRQGITDTKCTEIELLPEVTLEQVLEEVDMTWDQCCRFFNGKIVWMAPTVFFSNDFLSSSFHIPPVLSIGLERDDKNRLLGGGIISPCLAAKATTTTTFCVYTTEDTNPRNPDCKAACDFLVRLLASVGNVQQPDEKGFVLRSHQSDEVPPPTSCAALSRLLQDDNSNIRKLKLSSMVLNENHIRALATVSGSMEIILDQCRLEDDTECSNAFVQCLARNRGPTQLYRCRINDPILTAALTGNSRISRLKLEQNDRNRGHTADAVAHKGALLRVLAHNYGLIKLDLTPCAQLWSYKVGLDHASYKQCALENDVPVFADASCLDRH
jgi:hypothetical protein